jgi:uncharacterized membrane protein
MSFTPRQLYNRQRSNGFTLIEVLVIAPIVILVIGAFVGLTISIVGNVLVTRDENAIVYNTQDALDIIEQDVRLSAEFLTTTDALPSPQGSNNNYTGTSAFNSAANNHLLLNTAATNENPTDPSRSLLYYANQPNPCTSSSLSTNPNVIYNRVFLIKNIYFIKSNALWRRTYVPNYNTNLTSPDNETLCTPSTSPPWQQNTCSPGYTASRCQTQDAKILDNISSMSIQYFATNGSTTDIGPGNATSASSVQVSLTSQKTVAGRLIASTLSRRMAKLNQISPTDATSQWTYWPNGGGSGQLQNGWQIYEGWAPPGYIKTSGGVVFLKGLMRDGTLTNGTVVAQLPPGYRPNTVVTVPVTARTSAGANGAAVVQILTNGDITIWYVNNNATTDWVSLDGIGFLLDGEYPMTTLTLQNDWQPFISRYLRYRVDSMGRTHIRGQLVPGTTTSNTVIADLPSALQVGKYYHFMGGAPSNQYIHYAIDSSGSIVARGFSSSWQAFANMIYPSSFTGWTYWPAGGGTGQLKNGWVNYSSTYPDASYTKAADGIVSLRGLIKSGSISSGSIIAYLPPGYRPAERQIFDVANNAGFARVDVLPTGEITINTGVSSNGWIGLNDIQFVAEQ